MDDVLRGQAEAGRDAGFAGGAAHAGADFGDRAACFEEFGPRGAVDGPVHASAAEHPLVRGIDDGIDGKKGDVGLDDFDHGFLWTGLQDLQDYRIIGMEFLGKGRWGRGNNPVNLVNPVEEFIGSSCKAGICV